MIKKRLYGIFSIVLLGLALGNQSIAQTSISDSTLKDSLPTLPPLSVVLDSALKNSAAVQFRYQEIIAKQASLKSEKNYWSRNVGLQADTRYGTFDNFSSNNNGSSTSIFNTTSKQLNYGVGVYLKFPIQDILDRKNQIKRATAELTQSKLLAKTQEEEVTALVIKLYQDFLLKDKLLKIYASSMGNARANSSMIETEFRNGKISVAEYVRVSDIATRVETDFEKAKTEYNTAKLLLETVVGFKFTTNQY